MSKDRTHDQVAWFGGFLEYLHQQHFPVSGEAETAAYELLGQLGQRYPAREVCRLLAPVFGQDVAGEALFTRHYEAYLSQWALDPDEAEIVAAAPASAPWWRILAHRRFYWALQVALVLVVVALGFWAVKYYIKHRTLPGLEYRLDWQPATSLQTLEADTIPITDQQTLFPGRSDDTVQLPVLSLQPQGPLFEDISDLEARFDQQYGPVLKVGLSLLILTAVIFIPLYRSLRRRLLRMQERRKLPPYVWTVRSGRTPMPVTAEGLAAARELRRIPPQADGPDYLVLIETRSPRDMLAGYFDSVLPILTGESLRVERYFFSQDPRVIWKEKYLGESSLEALATHAPHARLVLIADAEVLFDPLTDEMASWLPLLNPWADGLCLLTPQHPVYWGGQELAVSRKFVLLPAITEALPWVVTPASRPPLRHWLDHYPFLPPPEAERLKDPAQLLTYMETPVAGAEARDMNWLCACALYGDITLPIVMALGTALQSGRPPDAARVQRLLALPWFREGSLPDDVRVGLMEAISGPAEQIARDTLTRMLRAYQPPAGSYAADEYQLNLAVQQAALSDKIQPGITLLRTAQDYALNHEIHDPAVIQSLRRMPAWRMPAFLDRMLFIQGIPTLGLQPWARLAGGLALVSLILLSINPDWLSRVQMLDETAYYLPDDAARMRYYADLGAWHMTKGHLVLADTALQQSLRLRNTLRDGDYLLPEFNLMCLRWQQGRHTEALMQFGAIRDKAEVLLAHAELAETRRAQLRDIGSKASYNQGVLYYLAQDLRQAEEAFRAASHADSLNLDAQYAQAATHLQLGLQAEGISRQNKLTLALQGIRRVQELDTQFLATRPGMARLLDSVSSALADQRTINQVARIRKTLDGHQPASPDQEMLVSRGQPDSVAFPQGLTYLTDFIEGLALVKYQGKYGFIAEDARLLGIKYDDARPYAEDLAAVQQNGYWGYINKNQDPVIYFRYEKALDFQDGRSTVRTHGRWGVIDAEGRPLTPFVYDAPVQYEPAFRVPAGAQPLAAVRRDKFYFYITPQGQEAFPGMRFDMAENFRGATARVQQGDLVFYIDRKGRCVPSKGPCP
ncbi:MAG: WG repeat-containing protein [Bacteroidia bacterium]|nr:WG repeat-containing protein [Bacteroidia bacterium]